MIDEKTIIKHLDIVLKNIPDIGYFNISSVLSKGIKYDSDNSTEEQKKWYNNLHDAVLNFGKAYKYFKPIKDDIFMFSLSEKGIKAKKLGHLKYQKSLKKKIWYNENWVGYLIAFIVLFFSVYQYFDRESLKSKYDFLKSQSEFYKDSLAELKGQIELYKTNSSKDTLRTKNLNDLKTD